MPSPPESTHDRLNRELARMRIRDVGNWGGWVVLIATAAIGGFFLLNMPAETRYVVGIAGHSIPLTSEDGANIKTQIDVEGQSRIITLPSQLAHPAQGEAVCLRAGEHRLTGHTSYVIVAHSLCDETSATPKVD